MGENEHGNHISNDVRKEARSELAGSEVGLGNGFVECCAELEIAPPHLYQEKPRSAAAARSQKIGRDIEHLHS